MKRLTRRDFIKRGTQLGVSVTLGSRLFPLAGEKVRVLGAHAYAGDSKPSGLSEVEAYK